MLQLLRDQPTLVVFLVIGFGYLLGRMRLAGVQLGASTGVLLGGLALGHLGVHGSSGSQSVGFILFIYCVGLRAGPQFFSAFRESGVRFAVLALVVGGIGVTATVVFGAWLDLPPGYRAGLLAGALTSTPTLVAAQDAVRDGVASIPAGVSPETVIGNIAASYAITYLVGLFGLLVVVSVLPRLMGIDLAAEARRLASEREESNAGGGATAYADMPVLRAYDVTGEELIGGPLGAGGVLGRTGCIVQGLKRGGALTDLTPETRLAVGDRVAVLGLRADHRRVQQLLGSECVDDELLEHAAQTRTILVTGAKTGPGRGASVATAAEHGCLVVGLRRAGMSLQPTPDMLLQKGDLVIAAGLPRKLDSLAQRIGRSELPGDESDLITFAFGIAAGIAIGLITVRVGGIPIGLGTAGGLLLSGLVIGFTRTANPTFGQLSVGATTVLMELGLQFFMANVGLEAGGSILSALAATGPWLPISALGVMVLPVTVGFVVGRSLLGFDPVILLGALTGSMTSTPALDMVNRQADSPLPTVGYAGTYAFANVLLAVAGSMLMRL